MLNTYLSHPKALTIVSEPIQTAVNLTCFDREIVDSPYFQRLHYILQNSTTFVAYPSNKNSRFVHSIGVCDVAGKLTSSAFSHASHDSLYSFLTEFAAFLNREIMNAGLTRRAKDYQADLVEGWADTIQGQSGFAHKPHIESYCSSNPIQLSDDFGGMTAGFLIDSLWQSVRICGLVHDIGHLPMSHSFEGALNKIVDFLDIYPEKTGQFKDIADIRNVCNGLLTTNVSEVLMDRHGSILEAVFGVSADAIASGLDKSIPLHERRSLLAFEYIFSDDRYGHRNTPSYEYRNFLYTLSFLILYASTTDLLVEGDDSGTSSGIESCPPCLRVLKSIIAGEVDADRMDYTKRDGHACGSPIGQFEDNRIVSNAILIKKGDRYHVGYYFRAISAIEQFYFQRYEGYKRLIYHRTSSRTEACLQELLARIFHWSLLNQNSLVFDLLVDFGYAIKGDDGLIKSIVPHDKDHMSFMDDYSLRTMLVRIRHVFFGLDLGHWVGKQTLGEPIKALLNIVLCRDFKNIWSPFKNTSLKSLLLNEEQLCNHLEATLSDSFEDDESRIEEAMTIFVGAGRNPFFRELKVKTLKHSDEKCVLITAYNKPKIFDKAVAEDHYHDQIYIIDAKGESKKICECSSLLNRMPKSVSGFPDFQFHLVQTGIKETMSEQDKIAFRKLLVDHIAATLIKTAPVTTINTQINEASRDVS